jgi:integral membrane protein
MPWLSFLIISQFPRKGHALPCARLCEQWLKRQIETDRQLAKYALWAIYFWWLKYLIMDERSASLRFFHRTGIIEGWSYLILLFVAMPMKYFLDLPEAVRIVGMLHGVLFVAFMYAIVDVLIKKGMNLKQAIIAVLLSIVPFGTFYLHKFISK